MKFLMKAIVIFSAGCALVGCDPKSSLQQNGPVNPESCRAGDSKVAEDGCNNCSCTESGEWVCTQMGCSVSEQVCVDGESKQADDGCNSCHCDAGAWACTEMACTSEPGTATTDQCPAAQATGEMCAQALVWARSATGSCCEYPTSCHAPTGWKVFYTAEECDQG